jgi:ribonuclease P/MRP protein subunit POP3
VIYLHTGSELLNSDYFRTFARRHFLIFGSLLGQIGRHRSAHTTSSKGKRSKKRKRTENPIQEASSTLELPPPPPAIQKHVTIGLNSTIRHLQSLLQPQDLQTHLVEQTASQDDPKLNKETEPPERLAATFLTETATTHLPYSHLPTLTALASTRHPSLPKIRLVQLKTAAEATICEAIGLPRAGVVGVLAGAPGAGPLLEYVRETVDAVDVPWTREVAAGEWLGTKILLGDERVEG